MNSYNVNEQSVENGIKLGGRERKIEPWRAMGENVEKLNQKEGVQKR